MPTINPFGEVHPKVTAKLSGRLECTRACTARGLSPELHWGPRAVLSNTDLSLPFKLPSSLSNLNTEISCNTLELLLN